MPESAGDQQHISSQSDLDNNHIEQDKFGGESIKSQNQYTH